MAWVQGYVTLVCVSVLHNFLTSVTPETVVFAITALPPSSSQLAPHYQHLVGLSNLFELLSSPVRVILETCNISH